jgi:hypothetical protein
MILQELTAKKNKTKAVADWIEKMQSVPQNDDGMTTYELANFLGISTDLFLKGTTGLISPIGERIENRGRNKIFSTEECRKLGKMVANGCRWRTVPKNAG